MTREEVNVLAFVAAGVLLGSVPSLRTGEDPDARDSAAAVAPGPVIEVDLFPIDINRAGPELLEELPGIGPAKAQAILAVREELGPFRSVDDLEKVHGIGPRTVERVRDLVIVIEDGETLEGEGSGIVFPKARDAAARERGHH